MTPTQELIQWLNNDGSLAELQEKYGVSATPHLSLPLTILNYSQIDSSPKWHSLIRASRGLVIEELFGGNKRYQVACDCIPRFFNLKECEEQVPQFDWNSPFIAQEKLDGSLISIFKYRNKWFMKTRASWGQSKIQGDETPTWEEAVCQALGISNLQELDELFSSDIVLVGELCAPWNKIVQWHPEPKFYLITVFRNGVEQDLSVAHAISDHFSACLKIPLHQFKDASEAGDTLLKISETNPTFEGFVFRDVNNERIKQKALKYLALHRLKGESGNMFLMKNLVPLALDGEKDEVVLFFPEILEPLTKVENILKEEYALLEKTWNEANHTGTQKEFALSIQGKTRFSSLLFLCRKNGQTPSDIWRKSADIIIKILEKWLPKEWRNYEVSY